MDGYTLIEQSIMQNFIYVFALKQGQRNRVATRVRAPNFQEAMVNKLLSLASLSNTRHKHLQCEANLCYIASHNDNVCY